MPRSTAFACSDESTFRRSRRAMLMAPDSHLLPPRPPPSAADACAPATYGVLLGRLSAGRGGFNAACVTVTTGGDLARLPGGVGDGGALPRSERLRSGHGVQRAQAAKENGYA